MEDDPVDGGVGVAMELEVDDSSEVPGAVVLLWKKQVAENDTVNSIDILISGSYTGAKLT